MAAISVTLTLSRLHFDYDIEGFQVIGVFDNHTDDHETFIEDYQFRESDPIPVSSFLVSLEQLLNKQSGFPFYDIGFLSKFLLLRPNEFFEKFKNQITTIFK